MNRHRFAALAVLLLLAGSTVARAEPAAKAYPTGRLLVGGQAVAAARVLDARAIPDLTGRPSLLVTLDDDAAAALAGAAKTPEIAVTLDGRPLGTSPRTLLSAEHVLQLSGAFGDLDAAQAIARRISGHDPVPDTDGD